MLFDRNIWDNMQSSEHFNTEGDQFRDNYVLQFFIFPPLRHFTILGHENAKNMHVHCRTGQKYGRKAEQQNFD